MEHSTYRPCCLAFFAFFTAFFSFLACFRSPFVILDIRCGPPLAVMAAWTFRHASQVNLQLTALRLIPQERHRFDAIAVRIADEDRVVPLVIMRSWPGRPSEAPPASPADSRGASRSCRFVFLLASETPTAPKTGERRRKRRRKTLRPLRLAVRQPHQNRSDATLAKMKAPASVAGLTGACTLGCESDLGAPSRRLFRANAQ